MLSRRSLFAALLAIAVAGTTLAQKKIKLPKPGKDAEIIFIGNSLTHFHDLPAFVRALGAADKPARKLTTVMLAPGGYTLQQHVEFPQEPRPADVIKKHKAKYVVLQEQSARPIHTPKLMEAAAAQLTAMCKKHKSVPVWYMTFARQHQPELQVAINTQYEKVHQQNGGLLAPVGRAWQPVRKAHPDLDLHMLDRIHPSPKGTYLTACVLYGTMFGGDIAAFPDKLTVKDNSGKPKVLVELSTEDGKLLRAAAVAALAAKPKNGPANKRNK